MDEGWEHQQQNSSQVRLDNRPVSRAEGKSGKETAVVERPQQDCEEKENAGPISLEERVKRRE